jgi:hypothetical protein
MADSAKQVVPVGAEPGARGGPIGVNTRSHRWWSLERTEPPLTTAVFPGSIFENEHS